MLEGAAYAVAEIIWWIAASAIVGILIGWILHRFFRTRRQVREMRAAGDGIAELEAELAASGDAASAGPQGPADEPEDDAAPSSDD